MILAQVETEASSGLAIDIDDEDDVQEIESLQVESADEKDDEVSVYVYLAKLALGLDIRFEIFISNLASCRRLASLLSKASASWSSAAARRIGVGNKLGIRSCQAAMIDCLTLFVHAPLCVQTWGGTLQSCWLTDVHVIIRCVLYM